MQVQQQLNQLPGVKAIPRDDALKKQHAESRIWNETWLAAFFHKPCNHELFVRQSLNMEGGPASCKHFLQAISMYGLPSNRLANVVVRGRSDKLT